jgi:protein-disulfide isomerase
MNQLSVPVNAQDHTQGPPDAACTLVEYGDFQCPSCRMVFPVVHRLQRHFGDRLRFVFRHFPLPQHAMAEPAAEAAEFAGAQRKFWPMHDALYVRQPELSEALLGELAQELELDAGEMSQALAQGTFSGRVDDDMSSGEDSGVHGTPTFFINGRRHEGSYEAAALIAAIEAAIAE